MSPTMVSHTTKALRRTLQGLPRTIHHANTRLASSTTSQPGVIPPSEQAKGRHDIVVDHQENVQTGYDSWAAQTSETAFTGKETGPEGQREQAEGESFRNKMGANPLDVSPANNEVSQVEEAVKTGRSTQQVDSKLPSAGGRPLKGAKGKLYESEKELKGQGSTKGMR